MVKPILEPPPPKPIRSIPQPPQRNDSFNMIVVLIFTVIAVGALLSIFMLYFVGITEKTEIECHCNCETKCYRYPKYIQGAHSVFDWKKLAHSVDDWGILRGYSMQPTFFDSNTALSMEIPLNYTIKDGELLRYVKNCSDMKSKKSIIHRVVGVYSDDKIVVSGDNSNQKEIIKRCQVTHVVIGVLFT